MSASRCECNHTDYRRECTCWCHDPKEVHLREVEQLARDAVKLLDYGKFYSTSDRADWLNWLARAERVFGKE